MGATVCTMPNMTMDPVEDVCVILTSNSNDHISDDVAMQVLGILWGKRALVVERGGALPKQSSHECDFRCNHGACGAAYFSQNSDEILKAAGFDFDNDMQLLGVGQRLEEAKKWEEGIVLFETYHPAFSAYRSS